MSQDQDNEDSPIEIDRRNNGERRQNLDNVISVLNQASNQAKNMSDRISDLTSSNATITRLLHIMLGLVVAKLVTLIVLAIVFGKLSELTDANTALATNNRKTLVKVEQIATILNECTSESPSQAIPPRKPISEDDKVHECRDEGLKNQGAAIGEIRDTNKNGVPDNKEILALLGDIKKELDK